MAGLRRLGRMSDDDASEEILEDIAEPENGSLTDLTAEGESSSPPLCLLSLGRGREAFFSGDPGDSEGPLSEEVRTEDSYSEDLLPEDDYSKDLLPEDNFSKDLPKDNCSEDLLPEDSCSKDFLLKDNNSRDLPEDSCSKDPPLQLLESSLDNGASFSGFPSVCGSCRDDTIGEESASKEAPTENGGDLPGIGEGVARGLEDVSRSLLSCSLKASASTPLPACGDHSDSSFGSANNSGEPHSNH